MQHMTPHSAYPTPPPPNMSSSSSSLANALGDVTKISERKRYQPEESTKYFDQYIDSQKKSMNIGLGITATSSPQKRTGSNAYMETPPTTPALPQQQQFSSPLSFAPIQSSSDPLALISSPLTPLSNVTPQKRKMKPEVLIMESPTKKREYAYSPSFRTGSVNGMTTPPPPSSPSISRTNTCTTGFDTPTTEKKKIVPYVEITTPTDGWWSQGHTPTRGMRRTMTSDDLGGYGSEEGPMSPTRSARRTGDRGLSIYNLHNIHFTFDFYNLQRLSRSLSPYSKTYAKLKIMHLIQVFPIFLEKFFLRLLLTSPHHYFTLI